MNNESIHGIPLHVAALFHCFDYNVVSTNEWNLEYSPRFPLSLSFKSNLSMVLGIPWQIFNDMGVSDELVYCFTSYRVSHYIPTPPTFLWAMTVPEKPYDIDLRKMGQ